jgi:hypothetical protein
MRTKSSFSRAEEYDYVPPRNNGLPAWLEQFAADQAKAEHQKEAAPQTAVDVARQRNNSQSTIYEQMSAIMSGTAPKYSSVEDAIRDYQKQTGLEDHMKQAVDNKVLGAAQQIVAAGEEAPCPKASSASGSGGDSNESVLVLDKGEDEDEEPDLVVKIPGIGNFVRNMIETNHGIQVPAVQHAVMEAFQRDGVGERDTDDPKFCRWINKIIGDKAPPGSGDTYSDLGRGVGTQHEYWDLRDSNRDPFVLLTPNKGVY